MNQIKWITAIIMSVVVYMMFMTDGIPIGVSYVFSGVVATSLTYLLIKSNILLGLSFVFMSGSAMFFTVYYIATKGAYSMESVLMYAIVSLFIFLLVASAADARDRKIEKELLKMRG